VFRVGCRLANCPPDISVADAEILNVPVEFSLQLVARIGSDFYGAERKPFDDVVEKIDRVGLIMFLVGCRGANPG
jgi:hypothetical protein